MPRSDNIDFDATRALIAQGIEERRRKNSIPVVGPDGRPTGEFYDKRLGKPPGQPNKADLIQILSAMQEKYPDIKVLPTGKVEGIPYKSDGLLSSIGNVLGRGFRESLTGKISAFKEKVPSLKPFTGVPGYIFDAIYEATKNVENFQPNKAEDIAASLASFLMPVDVGTLAIGGGAGGAVGKAGLKAGTAIAAKAGAKKIGLGLAKGVISRAKSAGALGAYEGAGELIDQVAKGDLDAIKVLKKTGAGAVFGTAFDMVSGGIGPAKAGASILSKAGREVGKFAGEVGVLGTVPPALAGRLPDFEDVKGAAKFAFALRIMNGAMKVPGFAGKGGDKLRKRWAERNIKKLEGEFADVGAEDLRDRVFEKSGVTTGEQARDRAREIRFKKKTKPSNAPAVFKPEKAEAELGKKVHGSLGLTGNETNIFMFTERFRGEPEQTKGKSPKLTKRGARTRSIYGEGKSGVVVGEYLKSGKKYFKILDIGSHGDKEIEARLKGKVEAYGKQNNVNIYLKGAEAKSSLKAGRAKKGATGLVRIEKSTAGQSLEALDVAFKNKEIDETTHTIYKELINENPELYANNPVKFTNKVVRATEQMLKDEGFTEKKGGRVLGTTVVERAKGGIVRLTTAINRGADALTVAEEHAHGFYEFRLRKGVKNYNAEWSKIVDDSYEKSGSKLAKEEWFAKTAAKHIIENVRTSLPGLASILDKLKKSFLRIAQVIKRQGLAIPKELEPLLRKVAREKLVKELAVKERKAGTRDRMRAKKGKSVSRETKKEVVVAKKPKSKPTVKEKLTVAPTKQSLNAKSKIKLGGTGVVKKGRAYYRYTSEGDRPDNGVGYTMWTEDKEQVEGGNYGEHGWELKPKKIIDIGSLQKLVKKQAMKEYQTGDFPPDANREVLWQQMNKKDVYREIERLVDEMNPKDIVNSAGFFDDQDLVGWLYDRFENRLEGSTIITNDGAISFGENAYSPVVPTPEQMPTKSPVKALTPKQKSKLERAGVVPKGKIKGKQIKEYSVLGNRFKRFDITDGTETRTYDIKIRGKGEVLERFTTSEAKAEAIKKFKKEVTSPFPVVPKKSTSVPETKGGKDQTGTKTEFHQIRIRDAYQNVVKRVSEIGQLTDKEGIAKDAIIKRSAEMEKKSYDIYAFRKKHEKGLTEAEKSDLIFYLEGTENPKIPTSRVISRLSPKAKTIAIALRRRFDQVRKDINASGLTSNRNYLEDYVTHFWKGPKGAQAKLRNSFKVKDPFAQRRGIEKYASEQAEKLGLKPKYHNIFDILGEYERLSERIVQNNEMARNLKNIKTQEGHPLIIGRVSKAPAEYVELRNNALASAIGGRGSVYVHPEIYKPLQTVFGEPFGGKFFTTVERINAITKKLKLMISMFHPVSLIESGLYSGIGPWKIKKGLKLIEDKTFRDDALESNLMITAPSDVSRSLFDKAMDTVARKFGPLGKALRYANKKNDQFLWDYMHPGLKAVTYYEKLNWALKKNPNMTAKQIKEIKRAVAGHVNNAFGGQNWDALLKSPKWRQVAHMLFLAPDWTLSNIKIATSVFKTGRGGIGAKIEGQLARRYWARAAVVFFTASNLANYALSGHWMWENEGEKGGENRWWVPDFLEGHRLDIDTGDRDEKNRRMFIRFSKQVREVGNWLVDPLNEALVKSSPFFQILFEQISGKSVTGWPTAIDKDDGFWESIPSRVVTLAKQVRPFSMSGNNALLSFPVRKGASPGEIIRGKLKSGFHRNRWRTRILDLYIAGRKADADKMLKEWNHQFPKFQLKIKDVSYEKIKARIKYLEKQARR